MAANRTQGERDATQPPARTELDGTPSQVTLLFTSYLVITAVAMLVTGWVSSRIGAKSMLLVGLALIVVFAALAGASDSIGGIVGFRAGWGVGVLHRIVAGVFIGVNNTRPNARRPRTSWSGNPQVPVTFPLMRTNRQKLPLWTLKHTKPPYREDLVRGHVQLCPNRGHCPTRRARRSKGFRCDDAD